MKIVCDIEQDENPQFRTLPSNRHSSHREVETDPTYNSPTSHSHEPPKINPKPQTNCAREKVSSVLDSRFGSGSRREEVL
jgi:hypothetical protein